MLGLGSLLCCAWVLGLATGAVAFVPNPAPHSVPHDQGTSFARVKLKISKLSARRDPSVPRNLLLYRDTNGWCPFCERTWLFLRLTNTPYNERLINLRDKPEYYLKLVPPTLVPAIQFDVHIKKDQEMIHQLTTDPNFKNVTKIFNRRNPIVRFLKRKKRVVMWESTQTMQVRVWVRDGHKKLLFSNDKRKKVPF